MINGNKMFLLCVCLSILANRSVAYRILAIFPLNVQRHNVMFDPLVSELCNRGHQVDVVTHFALKNAPSNCKVIVNLDRTLDRLVNNVTIDFILILDGVTARRIALGFGNSVCHKILALESVQKLIKNLPNDPPYDLVIVEAFGANCFFGFGHLLKVPIVAVASNVEYPWISSFIGNDDNLAYVATPYLSVIGKMTFWQRLYNLYLYNVEQYTFQSLTEKSQTEAMRKYISPDIPSIRVVEKSVALTLVNSHSIIFGAKPITPALVQIGGLHIGRDTTNLSAEMQKWIDNSSHGFVYFTFGSMFLIESLPTSTIQNIFKVFASIAPVRVLMKVADKQKLPAGLPSNVLTSPWAPQEALLAHKNVRLFITHGGLMGSQEALHYGVPMIGVPLVGDQFSNVAAFVAMNMLIKLNLDDLDTSLFEKAINTVLNNPKYRPMNAMDTAIYWIEYIVRNGPSVLRSPALDLLWWESAQLDIYAFIFVTISLGFAALFHALRLLIKNLTPCHHVKVKRL